MGKISYPLRLSTSLYDQLIALTKRDGTSIAHWLREAVREKLARDIKLISE